MPPSIARIIVLRKMIICDHILERCLENDENNNEVFDRILSDEQKTYIKLFYCQGGLDYSKMKASLKFVMKALVSSLSKKKDATPKEKDMAERLSHSYDIFDKKYIAPIVQYIEGDL